jgi:hypothetical protein
MCRSKNPQFGGYSVISRLDGDRWLRFWEADRGGAAAYSDSTARGAADAFVALE